MNIVKLTRDNFTFFTKKSEDKLIKSIKDPHKNMIRTENYAYSVNIDDYPYSPIQIGLLKFYGIRQFAFTRARNRLPKSMRNGVYFKSMFMDDWCLVPYRQQKLSWNDSIYVLGHRNENS